MSAVRYGLGAIGVVVGLWGAWLIFGTADVSDFVNIGLFLAGGIIANDGIIAVVALVFGFIAMRLLPKPARGPAAVGFVIVGTVALVAIPVVGRFGARADNSTLLDRDYTTGFGVLAAVVLIPLAVAAVYRMGRTGPDGTSPP